MAEVIGELLLAELWILLKLNIMAEVEVCMGRMAAGGFVGLLLLPELGSAAVCCSLGSN